MSGVASNLFVLGAPRCGTTTVHRLLASHRDIWMSEPKEPCHFAPEFDSPLSPYIEPSAYRALFAEGVDARYRGESTPWYLYSAGARARIALECAEPRFVVMLREPNEMMRSLHAECVFQGIETINDFERALDAPLSARRANSRFDLRRMLAYRDYADYARHLAPWIERFGPERVHVDFLERLERDQEAFIQRLFCFLGLTPVPQLQIPRTNARKRLRSAKLAEWIRDPDSLLRRSARWLPRTPRRFVATRLWGAIQQRPPAAPSGVSLGIEESASLTKLLGHPPPWVG